VSDGTSSGRWLVVLCLAAGAGALAAVAAVGFLAPVDATLGVAQRIFYFHVPSAWAMYAATALCAFASAVFLVTRSDRADALAAASGSTALVFCIVVLVSGSCWARTPTAWGVWWAWEPRLTSVLVLALILAAYAVIRRAAERSPGLARFAAALAVIGALDVPIIHLAVRQWRGRHPSVVGRGGGGLEPEMLLVLAVCLVAFTLLAAALVGLRYRVEVARREVARLAAASALGAEQAAPGSPA
jgi:heme exporter protein C